jgi:uncharacterized protein (TIGR02757 family)
MSKKKISLAEIKDILDTAYLNYAKREFIEQDPLKFVYAYSQKEDQEIAGLFAALLAWGKRSIILQKTSELLDRMDNAPAEFIRATGTKKLNALKGFKHRTFIEKDLISLVKGLHSLYLKQGGLEAVFSGLDSDYSPELISIPGFKSWAGIQNFRNLMTQHPGFSLRSSKHISNPEAGSAAKRLHLFLRWMVRKDVVDAGIWTQLVPADLNCPLDVHTGRVGRALGLIHRKQDNRKAVEELTESLRFFCPEDPIKYDLALFGLGEEGIF